MATTSNTGYTYSMLGSVPSKIKTQNSSNVINLLTEKALENSSSDSLSSILHGEVRDNWYDRVRVGNFGS